MFEVNADLPGYVQSALPLSAQTRFRLTANECLAKGEFPRTAILKAWGVVKQDWEKSAGDGPWVRKSSTIGKAFPRTLYICRYVQNGADIIRWAKEQGFKTTLPADELHVTVVYSKRPLDWMKVAPAWGGGNQEGELIVAPGGPRLVEPLGTGGAVVLLFKSDELEWRHESVIKQGASHDFNGYQPHITISWDAADVDLENIEPYQGKIVLGPEVFKEIDTDWKSTVVEKQLYAMQGAGLIAKVISTTGWEKIGSASGGNPYHDPSNGQFTSGPKAGGARHFATHTAGKVAAAIAAEHAFTSTVDWFTASRASGNAAEREKVGAIHDKLSHPPTQHSVASTVAKEILKALVIVGVEAAAATAIGRVAKIAMPFISGPGKKAAVAATTLIMRKVAARVPVTTALKATAGALGLLLHTKLAKAEVTANDLVVFQLQRLKAVLEDIDPSELAAQRAEEYLRATDPVMLKNVLDDLEDEGLVDYDNTVANHEFDARVVKVDKSLGLVFGYAIVCKRNGEDYYDLNIDSKTGERMPEHIPESAMLEAAVDFAKNSRVAKEMHDGDQRGDVVFTFPLTTEIAKALGIQTNTTGLLIAMKPDAKMLEKFASGELKGFSIGGSREKIRDVAA